MVNLQIIKDIARRKKITIRELAKAANITEQGLQRLIRNNSTTVETIDLIAKKLEVPVGTFFEEAVLSGASISNISGTGNVAAVGKYIDINSAERSQNGKNPEVESLKERVEELLADKRYLQKLIDKKK